ncbi:MAG: CHASE2 domain-containing protein [Prochloraceae cyanobacterium]
MIEQIKKIFRDWDGAIISFFAISLLIGVSRSLGWFQTWELLAFDWFYNLRTPEHTDERIIIVGINDADINSLSSYPVSDAVLADLIKKISQQDPRIIGLDLIRNFPVPPGNEEFEKVLLTTPNLVGISKVLGNESNPSIPAYDILEKQNRYTAADIFRDTDGKLRRGILYPPSERLVPGLGYLLAHDYLRGKGFNRTINDDGNLKYGEVVFPRFNGNDGGYVDVDRGGYQILINWRGKPGSFKTVSLTEVRSNRIPADLFKDKIVLIGVTSKTVRDDFLTPYTTISKNYELPTHGVEVQANFASHIISAVLDGRPTIQVVPDSIEYIWISFWIAIASGFAWYSVKKANKPELASLLTLVAVGGLITGVSYFCYWAFVNYGYWIPTVPLWLGMPISTAVVLLWGYITRIRKKQRELEDFLEALPVGVFICDRQGNPYYTNDTARSILGDRLSKISTAAELKESYKIYRPDATIPESGEEWPILKALEGKNIKSLDLEIEVSKEERKAIEVNASPIYDENEKITYAIAAFEDITERERLKLENQLLQPVGEESIYKLGGGLLPTASSYVVRSTDQKLYQELLKGNFCYVLNARQMGKSSLRNKIMNQLEKRGYCCAAIDLGQINSIDLKPEQWYASLVFELSKKFKKSISFTPYSNFYDWWKNLEQLSPVTKLKYFFSEIILENIDSKIFIFIDEIDSVRSLSFNTDDFFAFIRSLYNERGVNSEFDRLNFVMLGAASPNCLIRNVNSTPFNLGTSIILSGFKSNEVTPLFKGIKDKCIRPEKVLLEILAWTGGQPFLTQKVCLLVSQSPQIITEGKEKESIDKIVHEEIIDNWTAKDDPVHLKTIRDHLLDSTNKFKLLTLYQVILEQNIIIWDNSPIQEELFLSGLVTLENNNLRVFNKIYQTIFDSIWIESNL